MGLAYKKCTSRAEAMKEVKEKTLKGILKAFQVKVDIIDNGVDEIKAKGKGFEIVLSFNESDLKISCKLSLFLRPFKGKIQGVLEKEILKVI